MAALPNFDDPYGVADFGALPGEIDADRQSVTESQAVDMVMDCLIGRSEYAFGEPAEVWTDFLMDKLADRQTETLALILAPGAFGSMAVSLRTCIRRAIHREAERLLSEHHDAELEARYAH